MATNITDLNFVDGAQINVVSADKTITWVTSSLDFEDNGVRFDFHDDVNNLDFRVFLPWTSVDRIYQEI
jgi:hypothetical protein